MIFSFDLFNPQGLVLSMAIKVWKNVEGEVARRTIMELRSETAGLRLDNLEKEKMLNILEGDLIESQNELHKSIKEKNATLEFEKTKVKGLWNLRI